jgi:hypothetical protein
VGQNFLPDNFARFWAELLGWAFGQNFLLDKQQHLIVY